MKIIDLLNKIANGEEIPKKIRAHYRVFEKYLNHNAYLNTEDEENYKYLTDLPRLFDDDRDWLNDEVEIIEEEKKIPEKLGYFDLTKDKNEKDENGNDLELHYTGVADTFDDVYEKINEIIDCLDYLKSKGE